METLDKIVGQEAAIRRIKAALVADSLPQALVFVGPKGVGKRLVALSISHHLHNSEKTNHPDTFIFSVRLEDLKGQKHESPVRGTVEEMIRFLHLSPFSSKHKVVVLDDAEALTNVAQHALLKTLEELRADSFVVLLVENEQQLLPTILSRSEVVQFGPLSKNDLKQIVKDANEEILEMAMGSVGEAMRLAEDKKALKRAIAMKDFWEKVDSLDTEDKFAMTESIKEREEAMWFVRIGLAVWHRRFLQDSSPRVAKRLERLQEVFVRIKGNANQRLALEATLLVF